VHSLAVHLAEAGHEVVVLARQPTGSDAGTHPLSDALVEGVRVIAVAEDPAHLVFTEDMMAWTLALGHAMVRAGLALDWRPQVVHAHDWLVAHAAIALAQHFDVPLVATLHATEAGRHGGWISARMNRQVHSVEWWLARSADALITCSAAMAAEVALNCGLVQRGDRGVSGRFVVDGRLDLRFGEHTGEDERQQTDDPPGPGCREESVSFPREGFPHLPQGSGVPLCKWAAWRVECVADWQRETLPISRWRDCPGLSPVSWHPEKAGDPIGHGCGGQSPGCRTGEASATSDDRRASTISGAAGSAVSMSRRR